MSVLIGHASIDENGRASGGQAGDQTGKEVCVRTWYNGNWNIVLRPKSAAAAEKMAAACEILCRGNLVGYDQGNRNSLWDELERVGWDVAKLTVKCETDCSALVSTCVRIAGIDVPRVALGNGRYNAPITQTMRRALCSTGGFQPLADAKYLTSDKYLKRGDILLRESGHTAMVLGDGPSFGAATLAQTANAPAAAATPIREVKATEPAHGFDRALAGTYECTASALNIRNGAGSSKKKLTEIERGATVNCYGYYSLVADVKWLYIQFVQDNIRYTAFACANYLKKM